MKCIVVVAPLLLGACQLDTVAIGIAPPATYAPPPVAYAPPPVIYEPPPVLFYQPPPPPPAVYWPQPRFVPPPYPYSGSDYEHRYRRW